MSFTSTCAAFDYADLPVATYRADENVLVAGSKTGRLLFLKDGHGDCHYRYALTQGCREPQ